MKNLLVKCIENFLIYQTLCYNYQTYNFAFNHDDKFWIISIIKEVWTMLESNI
jgi:hypothetical protein